MVILGSLIKFKQQTRLIAGVYKNESKIKDKKGFASLVGGNVLILGLIFCAGAMGVYMDSDYKNLIEPLLLLSVLIIGILTFVKSKKFIAN